MRIRWRAYVACASKRSSNASMNASTRSPPSACSLPRTRRTAFPSPTSSTETSRIYGRMSTGRTPLFVRLFTTISPESMSSSVCFSFSTSTGESKRFPCDRAPRGVLPKASRSLPAARTRPKRHALRHGCVCPADELLRRDGFKQLNFEHHSQSLDIPVAAAVANENWGCGFKAVGIQQRQTRPAKRARGAFSARRDAKSSQARGLYGKQQLVSWSAPILIQSSAIPQLLSRVGDVISILQREAVRVRSLPEARVAVLAAIRRGFFLLRTEEFLFEIVLCYQHIHKSQGRGSSRSYALRA